jgi:nicotinamidase-related amidase
LQSESLALGDRASALLVVDLQNSFMPGGSLAVPRGDEVVPTINALARRFSNVVLTQDWHPAGHRSLTSPLSFLLMIAARWVHRHH